MTPSLKGIDWQGFLARPAFECPSPDALRAISGTSILVTGAGGSIGSALSLCLAQLSLPALVLLESGENNLYELDRALARLPLQTSNTASSATLMLGSSGNAALIERLFEEHRPRIVFHAAAYKHVPLLESQPLSAIANNIFATETITAAAARHGARMVLLSTDKAVEPASVMGATKRVAEEIVLATGGAVLRLGNVLASSGSVTQIFAQQIALGGPLSITAPNARRYFLTLDEAVNLLLRASVYSGTSTLLAPAFPSTHGIADLAQFMIQQLAPGREIPVQLTGSRPGDKMTERFWRNADLTELASDVNLISIQPQPRQPDRWASGLAALHASVNESDLPAALAQLCLLVPDYTPSQAVLALAHRDGHRVAV